MLCRLSVKMCKIATMSGQIIFKETPKEIIPAFSIKVGTISDFQDYKHNLWYQTNRNAHNFTIKLLIFGLLYITQ